MEAQPERRSAAHGFNARPLVLCAAGVSFGIFLAYHLQGTPALLAACLFLCCGVCAFFCRRAMAAVLLVCVCAGALRMLAALPAPLPEGACTLSGCVVDTPTAKGDFSYVLLYGVTCDGVPVSGRILVRFPAGKVRKLKCGDVISAGATLRVPRSEGGSFDARAYYLSTGVVALAYAHSAPTVHAHRIDLRYRLAALRTRMLSTLDAAFGTQAPLARALLLNDKALLPKEMYAAFRDAGAAHILALSGLHVSIFVGFLAAVLPKRHGLLRFFFIGAFLFGYCVLAGFPPSLVRVAVMSLCALGAPLLRRRYDMASALALALLILLFAAPACLFSAGLQLSFCATAGISMLLPPLRRLLRRLPSALAASASVSLAGTLGTLPLSLYYFERLPLYALPANLLLVPLVSLALPLTLLAAVFLAAFPEAAFLAAPARVVLGALAWASEAFASLPFAALNVAAPPAAACLLLYGAMLSLSQYHLRPLRAKLLCAALCLSGACVFLAAKAF